MAKSLTDRLCTRCALCCDGSLFADVELRGPQEAARLEVMGLEIDEDDDAPLLIQPCRALHGKRCGIYAHRPKCCRTFECQLLHDVRDGTVAVEDAEAHIAEALERVARVNRLVTKCGGRDSSLPLKERAAEALAREGDANHATLPLARELETALAQLDNLIERRFLRRLSRMGGRR
jgi:uncharacterized protein